MPREWTYHVPDDLRPRLEAVLSYRSKGAADIWGEVRDWLVLHRVPVPDSVRLRATGEEREPEFLTGPAKTKEGPTASEDGEGRRE